MTDFVGNVKQLNALPSGSVILAEFPAGAAEKHPDGKSWWFAGSHVVYPAQSVPLPARLLWNPEAAENLPDSHVQTGVAGAETSPFSGLELE